MSRLAEEGALKRDLRLALDQKDQADRLVEVLTKRCGGLRSKLVQERHHSEAVTADLHAQIAQEREARLTAEKRIGELKAKSIRLQSEVDSQRNANEELKKIAEAAMAEASETLKLFAARGSF